MTLTINATVTNQFENVVANDLIVIANNSTSRMQVKTISSVPNSNAIIIEGNTTFIGDGRVSLNATSYAKITGNASQLNIMANDTIYYNVSGAIVSANVQSIVGNVITMNVVASTSNTNLVYMVKPKFIGVSYKIISTNS